MVLALAILRSPCAHIPSSPTKSGRSRPSFASTSAMFGFAPGAPCCATTSRRAEERRALVSASREPPEAHTTAKLDPTIPWRITGNGPVEEDSAPRRSGVNVLGMANIPVVGRSSARDLGGSGGATSPDKHLVSKPKAHLADGEASRMRNNSRLRSDVWHKEYCMFTVGGCSAEVTHSSAEMANGEGRGRSVILTHYCIMRRV